MKADETSTHIPTDLARETELVIDHLMTGSPLAPDALRKLRERGDSIREEILRTHGVLDIGVPAIREARDK